MRSLITTAGAACALTLTSLAAQAGNQSRAEAFRLADGTIEVVAAFSENQLYWCGASLAARSVASGTDRIYVLQGPAPSTAVPGRTAVRFGLNPPAQAGNVASFTNSVELVGNSLTVVQAAQTCNERSVSQ